MCWAAWLAVSTVNDSVPPQAPYRSTVRGALLALAAVGFGLGIAILATSPPTDDSLYPRCQLHDLTGLHCPGCGATRAVHSVLNGRIDQGLAYNALAFIVLPVLAWSLARSLWVWYRNVPTRAAKGSPIWPWVIAALLIAYGVMRNLPWHPFTLLAPHELKVRL